MIRSRRQFLVAAVAGFSAVACTRATALTPTPEAPAPSPQLDAWRSQAQAMLADGLQTLRTFDVFAAYRVSVTPTSGRRSPAELVWDPPTGQAWDDATHVARGLRGRADQLFQAITTERIDASLWREQRALADVVHDIGGLGDALQAYRDRVDRLPPGDASGVLSLLDNAWKQWEDVAAQIALARTEAIGCAT